LGDELRSEIAKAVEDPPVYKGYVLIGLGCLVGVVVAVGTISAVMSCRSRGKRRSLTHYSLDEADIGQEPKDSIIKNSSGVGVGLMRARSATGNSQESANIRAVRSIINEHLPQGTRSLISSEEVCMRLLESGSSTEASSAENSGCLRPHIPETLLPGPTPWEAQPPRSSTSNNKAVLSLADQQLRRNSLVEECLPYQLFTPFQRCPPVQPC